MSKVLMLKVRPSDGFSAWCVMTPSEFLEHLAEHGTNELDGAWEVKAVAMTREGKKRRRAQGSGLRPKTKSK